MRPVIGDTLRGNIIAGKEVQELMNSNIWGYNFGVRKSLELRFHGAHDQAKLISVFGFALPSLKADHNYVPRRNRILYMLEYLDESTV